jgi:hypothetical protein
MGKNRDDFPKPIKDLLAKRAGFLCSNPKCRKPTVGSNHLPDKSTLIGEAAHITAASIGGPRYDLSLSPEERSDISNGIWLCANCASLIDKDRDKYHVETLRQWKQIAEESSATMLRVSKIEPSSPEPYIELDLVSQGRSRLHERYSSKNPLRTDEFGREYRDVSERPIIHWLLQWRFKLVIINNSKAPAYNISLESIGSAHFSAVDALPKKNNLPPFENIVLSSLYEDRIEGEYVDADRLLSSKVPIKLEKLVLHVCYYDDARNRHSTMFSIINGELINKKLE